MYWVLGKTSKLPFASGGINQWELDRNNRVQLQTDLWGDQAGVSMPSLILAAGIRGV